MSGERAARHEMVVLTRDVLRDSRRAVHKEPPMMRNETSESVADDVLEVPIPTTITDDSEEVHVLHVDDNPEIVELTQTFLEQTDDAFTVSGETNPVEAIQRIQEGTVDCVISDYDMPNTDGLELLEIVREQYPDLPFILYTAKGSEEIASEAISAGVTEYMQKETSTEQYEVLANRVRKAVERHRAQERFWDALAWYRRLAEQDLAGVFVVQDDEFIYVNDRFAEVFGYLREELLGASLRKVVSDAADDSLVEALLATTDGERRTYSCELAGSCSDGSEIDVEVYAGSIRHRGESGCIGLLWEADE